MVIKLTLCMVYTAVCPRRFYGRDCADRCNRSCLFVFGAPRCYRNGTCVAGCEPGWYGHDCSSGMSLFVISAVKLEFHWDQFLRNFIADLLATSPDHLDMSRWSESRQFPRNFLVTSWRLPRNICYGEVTGKPVPVEFELN